MKLTNRITSEEIRAELSWVLPSQKIIIIQSVVPGTIYTSITVVDWHSSSSFFYDNTTLVRFGCAGELKFVEEDEKVQAEMANLFKTNEKRRKAKLNIQDAMSNIRNYSITREDVGYDIDSIAEIDGWLWEIERGYEALEEEVEIYEELYPDTVISCGSFNEEEQ